MSPTSQNSLSKKRILLVDDEVSVLKALTLLLQALGHCVVGHSGGVDAINALQNGDEFDVLICDLRMPQMDGMEVIRRAKELRPSLPAILISGHATNTEVEEGKRIGIAGFLGKPFSPEQLMELMERGAP